jgi:hypothetical protein
MEVAVDRKAINGCRYGGRVEIYCGILGAEQLIGRQGTPQHSCKRNSIKPGLPFRLSEIICESKPSRPRSKPWLELQPHLF